MTHVSNEWADTAINGLHWIRNIVDGISDPKAALANMEECIAHCRQVSAAARAPSTPTPSESQAANTQEKGMEVVAWKPLTDAQWMNIVNHDKSWGAYSKDDAVHEAVKMTEAKCRENNSIDKTQADYGLTDREKVASDMRLYGTAFVVGGKRVPPDQVVMFTENAAHQGEPAPATASQEAVYQCQMIGGGWQDVTKDEFDRTGEAHRRIVYLAPPSIKAAEQAAVVAFRGKAANVLRRMHTNDGPVTPVDCAESILALPIDTSALEEFGMRVAKRMLCLDFDHSRRLGDPDLRAIVQAEIKGEGK